MRLLQRRGVTEPDAGLTLIEIMVSMVVMGLFMAIVTGAIIQVFDSVNRTESISNAQASVNVAFGRLDKQIRYASNISVEGTAGTDPAVDFVSTPSGTIAAQCTELRVHNGQLVEVSWPQDTPPAASADLDWMVLADSVVSTKPFTYVAVDSVYGYPRLQVSLAVTYGNGRTATTRQVDDTFYALNALPTALDSSVCDDIRGL